ncbi:unnamed protein product [Coccothraustes coccothraustes]
MLGQSWPGREPGVPGSARCCLGVFVTEKNVSAQVAVNVCFGCYLKIQQTMTLSIQTQSFVAHLQVNKQAKPTQQSPPDTTSLLDPGIPKFFFCVPLTHINPNAADSFVEEIFREDMENKTQKCPGTGSAQAGRAAACQGCPNQGLCAAGAAGPDPAEAAELRARLRAVRHTVLVLSGKGGVGKSTFSALLAHGLAADETKQVALLDIDICGPSIPKIMGLEGEQVHQSGSGWSPVYVEENLGVMSVGFLLSSPDDAVIWRGPKKNGLIKQFLRDVDWGEVDYLIVDTPPGTSDEHLSIVQYLSATRIDGAVIVTTPQEVSLQDVRKEINFCHKVKLPIIGVVENMSGFVCPKCKNESQIFPPTTGGAEKMCQNLSVSFLGKVPLDPQIGKSCDRGQSFLAEAPESPATLSYRNIIQRIQEYCEQHHLQEEKIM